MERLGRYYTQQVFSRLLVEQINVKEPVNIIDLGVGGGSLVRAAISKWSNKIYYAADVDIKSIQKIRKELPFVKSFHIDTLKENVSEKLNLSNNSMDIAVCNPPFLKIKNSTCYNELFDNSNLSDCKKLPKLCSEIIFLANNLLLLKPSGQLGIILPDSLLTGNHFQFLRSSLISNYDLKAIIQLPEKVFPKTEALTHILIIGKNKSVDPKTSLFLSDKTGQIVDEIQVDKDKLCSRMDFKFHAWNKSNSIKLKTLSQIGADIKRGTLTHKNLLMLKDNFVHTNQIKDQKYQQLFRNSRHKSEKYVYAKAGDILLSRVGRNSKVCFVGRGQILLSDCVYRIRVTKKYQSKLWKAFTSSEGQSWFKANSHGVCAKVISKKDLLGFRF